MGFIPYAYEIKGSDDFNVFFIFSDIQFTFIKEFMRKVIVFRNEI